MKKKETRRRLIAVALAIYVGFALFTASCGKGSDDIYNLEKYNMTSAVPGGYTLISEEYALDGVRIAYPRIVQYYDSKKAEKTNKLLYNRALEGKNLFETTRGVTAEIGWHDTLASDSLLSVVYSGSFYVKGSAHPVNVFYTENVGLENIEKLKLTDFYKVDKDFAEYLLYKKWGTEAQQAAIEYLKDQSLDDVVKELKDADGAVTSAVFSYYTPTGVGISISVPHSLGDHVEFEFTYDELAPYAI